MKDNRNHLLLGGGIVLGAAACGILVWWSATPLPPDSDGAAVSPAALQTVADSIERGAPEAPPAPPVPLPDPEETLRQSDSTEAATARAESAARMEQTLAEARRRVAEDPKAAFAWALQQGDSVRAALGAVLHVWASTDPAAAFEALRSVPDDHGPNLRAYGFVGLVEQWAPTNPAAAWAAVGTLPPSPEAAALKASIATLWAENDPAAASAALKALTSGGRSSDDQKLLQSTFAAVARQLALKDGARAGEWALGFAGGSAERASAIAGVIEGWAGTDPKAAAGWLERIEPGAARDAGAVTLAQMAVSSDPETSLIWAQTIADQTLRSNLTAHAAARWLMDDPKKAEAWIRKAETLSAEQKEDILEEARIFRSVSGGGAVR